MNDPSLSVRFSMALPLFVLQFSEDPEKVGKAGPVARPDKGSSPGNTFGGCFLMALHRTGEGMVDPTCDCFVPTP